MGGELGLFGVLFLSVAIAPCIDGKIACRASDSKKKKKRSKRKR